MNEETTLLYVFNQLNKEELGTERAKFTHGDHTGYVVGCNNSRERVIVRWSNTGLLSQSIYDTKVDWIGNKPKTKKLYAYLVGWEDSDFGGMIYNVNRSEKHVGERHNYFIKWLPEDKFPPIENED